MDETMPQTKSIYLQKFRILPTSGAKPGRWPWRPQPGEGPIYCGQQQICLGIVLTCSDLQCGGPPGNPINYRYIYHKNP